MKITQVIGDNPYQRAQAETLVQLAREQQRSLGGHRGSSELDAKLRIEREAKRARYRVTHWVVPSASARILRAAGASSISPAPFPDLALVPDESWL
jgi:hypothetical protein